MSSYNLKLFEYMGCQQIRRYKQPIIKADEKPVTMVEMEYIDGQYIFNKTKTVDANKIYKEEKEEIPDVGKTITERTPDMIKRSIKASLNRTKNKIYEIARSNKWDYFITLTFNPQKVNSKNYDYTKRIVHDWFVKMRREYAPDIKYLIVPELHKDGQKYHFHGLISNTGRIPMIDSGFKTKGGHPIYNIYTFPYGFTTATKVQDSKKVASYITKYITKDLCIDTGNRRRYLNSENCDRPRITEYNLSEDEIEQIMCDLSENITYMKTINVPVSHNRVEYIEVTDI